MHLWKTVWSLALPLVLIAGCADDSEGEGGSTAGGSLPCDVEALMAAQCSACHADPPLYGAPMPLVSVDDFSAKGRDGRPVIDLVLERISDGSMPPAPNEALGGADLEVVQAWADGGMPAKASEGSCGTGGEGGGPSTLSCEPDIVVRRAEPYTMSNGALDETKCFGVEVSNDGSKAHIIGVGPQVDNAAIVHHFLLFRAPEAQPAEAFDCSLFPPEWTVLYAWGPGAPPYELPEEAGFPIAAGETAHLVLQMHYNDYAGVEDPTDDTAVELCTTHDLRANDADVMSFGGTSFVIPANDAATMTCAFEAPEQAGDALPVHIFQAWPHMHQLGRSMRTTVEKNNGEIQTLVDVEGYSFDSQLLYPADLDLEAGDRVVTRCGWQNTTPEDVGYGEASSDEMCFNIVAYYPAITVPGFSGSLPSAAATCEME